MHDIKAIRDNPDAFIKALGRRSGIDAKAIADLLIALDEKRRAAILESEQLLARRNAASKDIGEAKKKKDNARADALMAEVAGLKTKLPELEAAAKKFEDDLKTELAQIPNLPLAEVPEGADEHGNVEKSKHGAKRSYSFKPKEHVELGEALKFMDFEAAAKMSGARFVVLKKGLARLERAIGQFMLDLHTGDKHGYTEVNPPLMVRDEAMFGTAQLPKFEEDQFKATRKLSLEDRKNIFAQIGIEDTQPDERGNTKYYEAIEEMPGRPKAIFNAAGLQRIEELRDEANLFWLIPTAEVPLTNLVRESILDEKELPMRFTALTPCFRAEAGAAGRDTRGMIRQHQFTKVELVSITTPEKSKEEHERMLACAEEVLKQLDLHYRVMTLCTGDMGFASQKTYDIEVWMPGQGEGGMYREISSCSVCGDFQARRMMARYRPRSTSEAGMAMAGAMQAGSGPRFVHTLNGSGTAVGRALIAVMETYQNEDGSISVPAALQPYMGGATKIERG